MGTLARRRGVKRSPAHFRSPAIYAEGGGLVLRLQLAVPRPRICDQSTTGCKATLEAGHRAVEQDLTNFEIFWRNVDGFGRAEWWVFPMVLNGAIPHFNP